MKGSSCALEDAVYCTCTAVMDMTTVETLAMRGGMS